MTKPTAERGTDGEREPHPCPSLDDTAISRAPERARADMSDGEVWADAMARTLERLDAPCTRTDSG